MKKFILIFVLAIFTISLSLAWIWFIVFGGRQQLIKLLKEKLAGHDKKPDAFTYVPCLAKLKAVDLLKAVELGASGILVVGCAKNDCIYKDGEAWGAKRVEEAKKLLIQVGLDPQLLEMHYL